MRNKNRRAKSRGRASLGSAAARVSASAAALVLSLAAWGTKPVSASNWAQISGEKAQNVAVVQEPYYKGRWGATAVVLSQNFLERPFAFVVDANPDPSLFPQPIGDALKDTFTGQGICSVVGLSDLSNNGANDAQRDIFLTKYFEADNIRKSNINPNSPTSNAATTDGSASVAPQLVLDETIIYFGGDSYESDEGLGQLYNKEWYNKGASWGTSLNYILRTDKGEPMPRIISQMVWLEGKEGSEPSSSSMCVGSDFVAPCGETAKAECEKGIEGQKACNDYRYGSLNLPDTNSLYISPKLCGDCKYSKMKIEGLCITEIAERVNCLGTVPTVAIELARLRVKPVEDEPPYPYSLAQLLDPSLNIPRPQNIQRQLDNIQRIWYSPSYREWLSIFTTRWVEGAASRGATTNDDVPLPFHPAQGTGSSKSFSQRRNAVGISFANRVYVLGGRTRSYENLPRRQCNKFDINHEGAELKGTCGDGIKDIEGCLPYQICLDSRGEAYDNVCNCANENDNANGNLTVGENSKCLMGAEYLRYRSILDCRWRESPKCAAKQAECVRERLRPREESLLTNEVWMKTKVGQSGQVWHLISPGCISPQLDLIGKFGASIKGDQNRRCTTDSDCDILFPNSGSIYGTVEKCDKTLGRCYCPMWSARESFSAAVFPAEPIIPKKREAVRPREKWLYQFTEKAELDTFLDEAGCTKGETAERKSTGPPQRIYVMGGYTHVAMHSCGDNSCGGYYRYFLNDIWRSKKSCTPEQYKNDPDGCVGNGHAFGEEWEKIEMEVPWTGRGGFSLLVYYNEMWLMGGRGGDTKNSTHNVLFNDVYSWNPEATRTPLIEPNPADTPWKRHPDASWSPRAYFSAQVVIDDAFALSDLNYPEDVHPETIVVFGGEDEGGVRNDCWNFSNHTGNKWVQDFSNGTLQEMYVGADSPVSYVSLRTARTTEAGLTRVAGQGLDGAFQVAESEIERHTMAAVEEGTLTEEQIAILNQQGIFTIKDLAEASKEQILNLRGGGTGEGWQQYRGGPFRHICPWKKRAMEIMNQCVVKEPIPYEVEIDARLGMLEVKTTTPNQADDGGSADMGDVDGCNPDQLTDEEEALKDDLEREEEAEEIRWEHRLMLDGEVDVTCRIVPEARSHAASVVMGNKMYVMGGFSRENTYLKDAWYRDDLIPNVALEVDLNTGYEKEHATRVYYNSNNKPGSLFEYRMELLYGQASLENLKEDPAVDAFGENPECISARERNLPNPPEHCQNNLPSDDGVYRRYIGIGHVKRIVRNWTISSALPQYMQDDFNNGRREKGIAAYGETDFLSWKEAYIEAGWYKFSVRAIDPSGNKGPIQQFDFLYQPPFPYVIVGGSAGGFVFILLCVFLEYRRRVRKAAMERYAQKRMRRKFKGLQKKAGKKDVNWRKYMKK